MRLPRLVVAAPASGHGKTTIATGLMAALRAEGLVVAGFKVGPDYIDPGYHALATGRPGRNLDPFLCGEELIAPLLLHGAATPEPADLAVVEGVMGLFDGRMGGDGFASTAHVARLIDAPVIMVVDISQVSRTAAAIVHGLHTFDPEVRLAGVVLNKAGTARHAEEVARALEATGLPVLGVLPRDAGIEVPSRHLGLVPAAERELAEATVARLGAQVAQHLSLSEIVSLAHRASALEAEPWSPESVVCPPSERRPVVAVAGGRAFTFRYAETEELLRAAGCEPVVFDPLTDPDLPPGTAGLYLGGGFPEVHATELTANTDLRTRIADAVAGGMPTVAECAGLLYLARTVDGAEMVGALPAEARMDPRLTLGYRTLIAPTDSLLGPAGLRATGHEFHRTVTDPSVGEQSAWLVDGRPSGFAGDSLHASYLHVHWAGHPRLAQRFAQAVHAYAVPCPEPVDGRLRSERPSTSSAHVARPLEIDLHHHGDSDIAPGLIDLAVNVRLAAPPDWLAEVINASTDRLAAYPRTGDAVAAISAAHGVPEDAVLPTAGGAEAFTLIARAFRSSRPVVVHPQFTEPEAALRAAGHEPGRILSDAGDGFRLHPESVPPDADLVMIGNPTNPTGVLHPAAAIAGLRRPGRIVVVDEAFLDAVPGEAETLIGPGLTGLLVLRSLTKTWGLAGLRAGYVVGDPELIAALRAQQPPWSVSTPALAATVACLSPRGRAEAAAAALEIGDRRAHLVRGLASLGLPVAGAPQTPFVLIDTAAARGGREAGWLRLALRDAGFAVRRGDTFPGLGPDWIRIAVREPAVTDALLAALHRLLRPS